MKSRASLATKFGAIGVFLLLLALLSIGVTMQVTGRLNGGAAAIHQAQRMQMQTWRLVSMVQAGDSEHEIKSQLGQIENSLAMLRDGDGPGLRPWSEATEAAFRRVAADWLQHSQLFF